MNNNYKILIFALGAITISVIGRIVPHLPNFTPIIAISLLSGMLLKNPKISIAIALVSMLISDFITVNFINHSFTSNASYFTIGTFAFIYLPLIIIAYLGTKTKSKLSFLGLSALSASLLFWVISNFGVWIGGGLGYALNASGFLTCYTAALPFLGYQLAGDLFYTFVCFGIWNVAETKWSYQIK